MSSRISVVAINSLALARTLAGASLLASPRFTASLFSLPTFSAASVFLRLCGARDAALGGLLWSSSYTSPELRTPMLRQALIIGAVVDVLDGISVGVCFLEGNLKSTPAALIGGGALLFLGLGLVGLKGITAGDVYARIQESAGR